jgi:CHAD domain-containing protein
MFGDDQPLAEAISTLEESLGRVPDWPLQKADWGTLGTGMKLLYKQGRHAMQLAYSGSAQGSAQSKAQSHTDPAKGYDETFDETFHEWRKRVKDLWYQTLLLGPTWPELMRQFAKEAHQLSDDLGDDHDLAVLHQTLIAHQEQIKATTLDTLTEAINFQRERLQQRAHIQGQHLYAEKPSAYASRLEAYWQAWRT